MRYNFEQFEYFLAFYGNGSTYFLKRHPNIKQFLQINSAFWLFFMFIQVILSLICDDKENKLNNNYYTLIANYTIKVCLLANTLMCFISFIQTSMRINDLRKFLVKMRQLSVVNSSDKSKVFLAISIVF